MTFSPQILLNEPDVHKECYFHLNRQEMVPFVPMSARFVLDVGCGAGGFGQQLKTERGITVWGVESNRAAAALARERLDYVAADEFSPSVDLQGQQFDCIIFNDVLEHMYDPWTALAFAKEHLTEAGVVVASIPNMKLFRIMWDLLIHDEWTYTKSGVLDVTHIRFFTKKEIVRLFNGSGYLIDQIVGINSERQGRKFHVLNTLFRSRVSVMRYLQFAVVARPAAKEEAENEK